MDSKVFEATKQNIITYIQDLKFQNLDLPVSAVPAPAPVSAFQTTQLLAQQLHLDAASNWTPESPKMTSDEKFRGKSYIQVTFNTDVLLDVILIDMQEDFIL